ncbi:MAG TPA: potassium-transporting ATPase subunit KdpA, partial [Balneolales bacterium]|nr:potassium-transporting ATPase subunit KdpA [Balneolales bacterium]
MNTELIGVLFILLVTVALASPLGRYVSRVFKGERTLLDFMAPLERFIFRMSRIDPNSPMDWKQNAWAMIKLNVFFFAWAIIILLVQSWLPFWNPNHIGGMSLTQAFHTAVSFATNTNQQHYLGETGASYFTQLLVFGYLQFVSAGTGIAALALVFKGLSSKQTTDLGNFYNLFLKSCTRILLPLAIILAIFLLFMGTPDTFQANATITTLEGHTQTVATGPAAPMVAIKQLGTNGGGFFGVNSAHPFENPNYVTNIAENVAILLIPMALVFAFGFYLERMKLAWIIFGVMMLGFLIPLGVGLHYELHGNPAITKMGVQQPTGYMEGNEVRFGPAATTLWAMSTTTTSNGSVNGMHDSLMPLTGAMAMLNMFMNCNFGGVGVGFLNFFLFLIVAVFIAGLMIGRTPEWLGKKIEGREVTIAALLIILHPLLVLSGTALSTWLITLHSNWDWLNNPGFHGFSEMLYEFTSASANNGSGFEGLIDNTVFWNLS